MRYATFNVLADAYTSYGNYGHVAPELMRPGARLDHLSRQIKNLGADVVGLQEADRTLVEVFECDENWQSFWTPKGRNKPDGCLTLVKKGIDVTGQESFSYDDESGHVFQVTNIGEVAIANTHIKWSPEEAFQHTGVTQTQQLLDTIRQQNAAVILADCNGRPEGRVQTMVKEAGFTNMSGEMPTAVVNGELVAIDLLAIRGLKGTLITTGYDLHSIPNKTCASDHIPVVADISLVNDSIT